MGFWNVAYISRMYSWKSRWLVPYLKLRERENQRARMETRKLEILGTWSSPVKSDAERESRGQLEIRGR